MEFEIDNRAPRDMVDPEFLNRMMACDYSEPVQSTFGNVPHDHVSDVSQSNKISGDYEYAQTFANSRDVRKNKTQNGDNGFGLFGLSEKPLAMVYAPVQMFRNIYDPEDALAHGTIFKELDFPWNVGCSAGHSGGRRDGTRRG